MGGSSSTAAVDYLQRIGPPPTARGAASVVTRAEQSARRLERICRVGRYQKYVTPDSATSEWKLPTATMLSGLFGHRVPLVFAVSGTGESVDVSVGTWSRGQVHPEVMDGRQALLRTLLHGSYPTLTLADPQEAADEWPCGGLVLGVPSVQPPSRGDVAAPWDRLIRSMRSGRWKALVLAYPAGETTLGTLRDGVLNEIRRAQVDAAHAEGASPLAEYYISLLRTALVSLNEGGSTGAWRTATYLLGDAHSYPQFAAQWRAVFSGPESLPEPVRVFDRPDAPELSAAWAMDDEPGTPGPSTYRRPLEYQTILTSGQLAAYIHLPEIEVPGFAIDLVPRFDTVAHQGSEGDITLGRVMDGNRTTSSAYSVRRSSLTRHGFVAGLTGAGKTNTITHLLQAIDAEDVPFLVLEPAKTEYRALASSPQLGQRLRVFTAGNETVSPLRLNPFEVPDGVTVSEHLDLLRAVFAASFGMWTPLPQVLERCLHEVYADKGWDLRTNLNARLEPVGAMPPEGDWPLYPTISDLIAKVDEVVPQLGYQDRIRDDIRAALVTRLDSLRSGGKGAMLDVVTSIPIGELLDHPTVLELEPMGDESDKAFLMGLLVILLAEHRRTRGRHRDLQHLLVIEEAHRLLADVPPESSELTGNARGHAMETFSNLLSEIRAYGQGVLVADQVPTRLAPDVLKNTNLKIAHRTVSADDRGVLGSAMAMNEAQTAALTVLGPGEAAVFSEGDDAPLLVRVPLVVDGLGHRPEDERVAGTMVRWRSASGVETRFLPRPYCAQTCAGATRSCEVARRLVADEAVQRALTRTVLSGLEDWTALDRLWRDLVAVLAARLPPDLHPTAVTVPFAGHAAYWYAERRGAQGRWSYSATAQFGGALCRVLVEKAHGVGDQGARAELQRLARELHHRPYPPYPACTSICSQQPAVCLYRSSVADVIAVGRYQRPWREAEAADAPGGNRAESWQVAQDAGFEIIQFPDDTIEDGAAREQVAAAARRASLCFGQQMLAHDERKTPATVRRALDRLLRQAGVTR